MKYSAAFKEKFGKQTVFTTREARLFLKSLGASEGYQKLFLHNLAKGGQVFRITKGVYALTQELQAVGLAYRPYYYGLQDALSMHNLWEQETVPVVITPRKVRNGTKTFLASNYLVKRIARKMFFGYETMRYRGFWINVSTPEKTLIDFAYFKQHLPKQALEEMKKKIVGKKKLGEYLRKCPKWVRKRIGKLLVEKHANPR